MSGPRTRRAGKGRKKQLTYTLSASIKKQMHAKKKTHGQKIGLSKYLIEIPKVGSKKTGSLYFAEINKHIPFDVKRIYYIANVQDAARGFHAHKQTVQVLFCIKGSVKIILETPEDREEFVLDQAHAGLILDKMVWHEMTDFEEDTLVLVLASDFYNESDYIRNYNDFVALSRPQIKFNDFKKEYQSLKTDIDSAVGRALESGWYILGEELKRFEQDFANYCGTKYCVGVGNAYDGLKLVLKALGVGPGDEVITTAHTAVATALAITDAGAIPVFADIDEYYCINPTSVASMITPKTKAIIPVHLYGQPCDLGSLKAICDKHGLFLIEDCAQAHGAMYNGSRVGSFGDAGVFSFYPTKNLGAYGDAGAIVTNNQELSEKCAIMRHYGQKGRYEHLYKGVNSRLDELQAAILNAKLPKLDMMNDRRREIAEFYDEKLKGLAWLMLPKNRPSAYHVYHLYVVEVTDGIDRDAFIKYLAENNIMAHVHYPIPIHKQVSYAECNDLNLPETEYKAKHIVSLPIHPFLENSELDYIVAKVVGYKV